MLLYLAEENALTLVQVRYTISSSYVVIKLEHEILLEQKIFLLELETFFMKNFFPAFSYFLRLLV